MLLFVNVFLIRHNTINKNSETTNRYENWELLYELLLPRQTKWVSAVYNEINLRLETYLEMSLQKKRRVFVSTRAVGETYCSDNVGAGAAIMQLGCVMKLLPEADVMHFRKGLIQSELVVVI